MKKQLIIWSLIALFGLISIGCSKDDDNNGEAADGELIAKVDGAVFKATTHVSATFFNGLFQITAIDDATGETIIISVLNAHEGTFDLGPDPYLYNDGVLKIPGGPNYSSDYEGGGGSITITSLNFENGTASGTFHFKALSSFGTTDVTDGEFKNVHLETEVPISAQVNGEAFKAILVNSDLSASQIFIIGLNVNEAGLILEFPNNISPGNYEFGPSTNHKGFFYPDFQSSGYKSESGTLTITEFNTNANIIKGTFSFRAKPRNPDEPDVTYEITAGSFSAKIE
ncbi:hypothetical protein F3C99_01105 [Vitellibacter sp. q18]|nr:hypothetical protein [Aequorivita lutea]